MLKIKDKVNLKKLEDYGFKEDKETWTYWKGVRRIIIYKKDRRIAYNSMANAFYDILFDLITANLVEKTEYKRSYETRAELQNKVRLLEEKIRLLTQG